MKNNFFVAALLQTSKKKSSQRSRRFCLVVPEKTCVGTWRNAVRQRSCFAYNSLDKKTMNVQFCSNLSSTSAGSRLALLWTNQLTDFFFNVFRQLHLLRKFEEKKRTSTSERQSLSKWASYSSKIFKNVGNLFLLKTLNFMDLVVVFSHIKPVWLTVTD